MGDGKATSGSDLGESTAGKPTPDWVGSKQDVGDAWKNTKGKGSHKKKKGWTPKAIATLKFEVRTEELKGHVFDLHGLDQAERFNWSINEITK